MKSQFPKRFLLIATIASFTTSCSKSTDANPTIETDDVRVQIVAVRPETEEGRTIADFSGSSGSRIELKAPAGQKLYQFKLLVTPKRPYAAKESEPMLQALAQMAQKDEPATDYTFRNPFLEINSTAEPQWVPTLTVLPSLSQISGDDPTKPRMWYKMAIPNRYEWVRVSIPVGKPSTFVVVHSAAEAATEAQLRLGEGHQTTIKLGNWGEWK